MIKINIDYKMKDLCDYFPDWEAAKIASNIFDRCDGQEYNSKEDAYKALYNALDSELIYTHDQWQIMKAYQSPQDANYNEAIELFLEDLSQYFYDCATFEEVED